MSDTPREQPGAIPVDQTVNARELSRHTGPLLREVAFEGRCLAIRYCGRVVGFVVPVGDRAPVRRGGKIVYEVPEPQPLLELTDAQAEILGILHRDGESVPDRLIPAGGKVGETLVTLSMLELSKPPLIRKSWMGYKLTPEGARHAEELGL